jgi:capsular polysaccharide biosynthesis protein
VQVNPPTTDVLQNIPVTTLVNMDTEKQIAESTAVAEKAAEALGTNEAPEALLEDLSVSVPTNSLVLEITFADPDPARAQAGAQAFADAYLSTRSNAPKRRSPG